MFHCTDGLVCHPFTYGGTVRLLLVLRDYVRSCYKHLCADFCVACFLAIRHHDSVLTRPPVSNAPASTTVLHLLCPLPSTFGHPLHHQGDLSECKPVPILPKPFRTYLARFKSVAWYKWIFIIKSLEISPNLHLTTLPAGRSTLQT